MRFKAIFFASVLAITSATAVTKTTVWNVVTQKSVVPSDAASGVASAIADAKVWLSTHTTDTLELYFPSGTYVFNNVSSPGISIGNSVNGTLRITGNGKDNTRFVFTQFDQLGIKVVNSSRVVLQKFHVTRPTFYTTQGTITALQTGSVTIQLDNGFPDPVWLMAQPLGDNNEKTLLAYDGDPVDPKLVSTYQKVSVSNVVDLTGGYYRFSFQNTLLLPSWSVNDHVALKCKVGLHNMQINNSDDIILQDIRSTCSSNGTLWATGDNNRIIVQRVSVERPAAVNGKVPFFSQPSDGIHVQSGTYGPTIRNCSVTGTADDGIAVFSNSASALMINTLIQNNTIRDVQPRGILITQSQDGNCSNNIISRSGGPAIGLRINADATGTTAAVKNWLISNNEFNYCMPTQYGTLGVIDLSEEIDAGLHTDIRIENNTFNYMQKNGHVIGIDDANIVSVTGNVINSFSTDNNYITSATGNSLVYVAAGKNISGDLNCYYQPTSRTVWSKVTSSDLVTVKWGFVNTTNNADINKPSDTFVTFSDGYIRLHGDMPADKEIKLIDSMGKVVTTAIITGSELAVPTCKPGMYFVFVRTKSESAVSRIIVR